VKRLKAFSSGGSSKKMEKSGNIEDQVMDHLLRNFIKQQSPPESTCQGFDPDLASLYLERVLTEKEAARYETHLYECTICRTSVVSLAHFSEQEISLALTSPVKEPQPLPAAVTGEAGSTPPQPGTDWFAPLKQFLALLTIPRYALGAVAAIVLAISMPLVISQRGEKSGNARVPSDTASQPAPAAEPGLVARAEPTAPANVAGNSRDKDSASQVSKTSPSEPEGVAAGKPEQPASAAGAASGAGATAPPAGETPVPTEKKADEKATTTEVAENKARAEAPPPPAVATAQPAPRVSERRELERIDPEVALKTPRNEQDGTSKTLKPGASDGSVAARKPAGPTIRPDDAKAKPPATASEVGGRRLADKSKSLRQDGDDRKDRARASASRKVDGKTFWLIDDIWTDKDYRKEKELPVVPLTRESDLYREVLEKHSGLQKFFKGFAANEKLIVVYKGTVYRVLP
jgi:hypothetical protein